METFSSSLSRFLPNAGVEFDGEDLTIFITDLSGYGNALWDSVITWISLVIKVLATFSRISLIDEIIPSNPIRPMRGGGLQVCGGVNDWNVQYTNSTVLTSNVNTLMKTVISDRYLSHTFF